MHRSIVRLLSDESGQDLIEYALLTTFVSLAAIAVFDTLLTAIGNAYTTFNGTSNGLWYPPAPAGS